MGFEQIAETVSNFDPWWMIAVATLCFLLDWAFVHSDALSAIAFGVIILAILNFLGMPANVQLFCYPLAFFFSYFGIRRFIAKLGQVPVPFENNDYNNLIGKKGIAIVVKGAMTGKNYYYEYKRDIDIEKSSMNKNTNHGDILKIKMDDGQVYPAKLLDSTANLEGIDGSLVEIVSNYNGLVIIKSSNE